MRLGRLLLFTAVLSLTLTPAQAQTTPVPPTWDSVSEPVAGQAALAALGDRLDEVAADNAMTTERLHDLLSTDASARIDPGGRLAFSDPAPPRPESPDPVDAGGAALPPAQTFTLHSKPGAQRTIYLDFTGGVVADTIWNQVYGVPTTPQPPFDLDGRPGTWSAAEHALIQHVFTQVAEDYAPFDVDVTTAEPKPAALQRSSLDDQVYGTQVLITPSDDAWQRLCAATCGGYAYVGVFDEVFNLDYQPAWVFPQPLWGSAKNIAEAASHEAGHNLGLLHDGTATESYYGGRDGWAPIMGAAYYEPVSQWSRGEYPGASNTEDDLAVISTNGLPLRPDDHGDTRAGATAVPTAASTATGVITTAADVDLFRFDRACTGPVTVQVHTAQPSPNLDVQLRVLAADGTELATADPGLLSTADRTAVGLSASLTATVAAGRFYASVDGVGHPSEQTSDYGSLGAYTITATRCGDAVATVLTPTPDAAGVPVGTDVTVGFNEAVTSVNAASFSLREPSGELVAATVSLNAAGTRARLNPTADLAPGVTYIATLSGVRGVDGSSVPETTWTFSTLPPPPLVYARSPRPGQKLVPVDADITADFDLPVTGVGGRTLTLTGPDGNRVPARVGYADDRWRAWLRPDGDLLPGTRYTVTLTGGSEAIRSGDGIALKSMTWAFTTATRDTTAPAILTRSPAPGAAEAGRTDTVWVQFSQTVTRVSPATFVLKRSGVSTPVPATVSYDAATDRWVLDPAIKLAPRATYVVTLVGGSTGIRDLTGNPVTSTPWGFSTGN